jgi:hypothetical protein
VYIFQNAYIVHPEYFTSDPNVKDKKIAFEEKVDNALVELFDKTFALSVEEQNNVESLLPDKYKHTTRLFRLDQSLDWHLFWNKMFTIFQ